MSQNQKDTVQSHRLPIWVLKPSEEKEARSNLKSFAYGKCAEYVKRMADCAKSHGIKVFPACEKERDQMGECLLFYQMDPKYLDEERDRIVERKIAKLEQRLKEQNDKK